MFSSRRIRIPYNVCSAFIDFRYAKGKHERGNTFNSKIFLFFRDFVISLRALCEKIASGCIAYQITDVDDKFKNFLCEFQSRAAKFIRSRGKLCVRNLICSPYPTLKSFSLYSVLVCFEMKKKLSFYFYAYGQLFGSTLIEKIIHFISFKLHSAKVQ